MKKAADIISALKLSAHPEGGHFVETFRDTREATSLIFYLLIKGETSHWHRLSKNEILHFYDGDPMKVKTSSDGQKNQRSHAWKRFYRGSAVSLGGSGPHLVFDAIDRQMVLDRMHGIARFYF